MSVPDMPSDQSTQVQRFARVERVVADPLRFKLRLGIGENAYASLRLKKSLQDVWDVAGIAATGAGIAASPAVATTFFASTASGGVLSLFGLGTAAATPVGWIAAAALASGGAYYGVSRLFRNFTNTRVEKIPKFINTPIDLLAMTLFDLIGSLAVRVAAIDGVIADEEQQLIAQHFVVEWGLDRAFVEPAMTVVLDAIGTARVKDLARALASFQTRNPDCNPVAMQAQLMQFLDDVIIADGVNDEREELALDAIRKVFQEETEFSFRKAGRSLSQWSQDAASALQGSAQRALSRKP